MTDSPIRTKVKSLTNTELFEIFQIAEEFESSLTVPNDSPLRKISKEIFGGSDALQMLVVIREVYRILALKYIRDEGPATE